MRTLQEKYNGVLEGNFSKTQFLRDARMAQPQFITQYNSFEDAVQILKNKGMVTETKVEAPKYSTAKPEDHIAPDVLDTGIKFELDAKYGTLEVTDEQYAKAKAAAIKNLTSDVLYYVKQDGVQLDTPGDKMEKVKIKLMEAIKTIVEAEEAEEEELAPEAPADDYSHLANALKAAYEADGENTDNMTFQQTCANTLENGEVEVCFDALKAGNVIDEFKFLVSPDQDVRIEAMSIISNLGQMEDSVDSLSSRIVNHWDSLQAPVEEGHGVEETMKEGLDYETLEYMEGQVNIKAVDALIAAARIIIRDLEDFDQEDVFEFLVDRLRTLEPIRESK